jgi:hypothetical protein
VVKTIDQRIEALKTVTDINSEVEAMLRFDEKLLERIERLARNPCFRFGARKEEAPSPPATFDR